MAHSAPAANPFGGFSAVPAAQGLYDPPARRMPAAWPWSRRCAAPPATTSSPWRSMRCATSSTAARSAPMPAPATARASSRRSPTPSCARWPDFELPPVGRYAVGMAFLPLDADGRAALKSGIAAIAAEEGLRVLGWREVPTDPDQLGNLAREAAPAFEQLFVESTRIGQGGAPLGRHRARPADLPAAQARRARTRRVLPVAVGAHPGLQGHGHDAPARAVLPRPLRRAVRLEARARALALLDEHLPVVAARPAVPDDRAQRRDQHGAGQPQLDARPPVPARVGAARRPAPAVPDRHARARATRPRSTRSSSSCCCPAGRCRTRS